MAGVWRRMAAVVAPRAGHLRRSVAGLDRASSLAAFRGLCGAYAGGASSALSRCARTRGRGWRDDWRAVWAWSGAVAAAAIGSSTCVAHLGGSDGDEAATQERVAALRAKHGHAEVFEAVASSSVNGVSMMTFEDFVRSRLYHAIDFHGDLRIERDLVSAGRVGDMDGRISYPEFVFLSTVLAIPLEYAAVAFVMCDLNQNGVVDRHELVEAIQLLAKSTSVGFDAADHAADSFLPYRTSKHLFGADGARALDYEHFVAFARQLKIDVLRAEFSHYSRGADIMTHRQFARFLVANSSPRGLTRRLARVETIADVEGEGFSEDEFMTFCLSVVENSRGIGKTIALSQSNRGLSPNEMQRVVEVVSQTVVLKSMINVLVSVFDENGDGRLDMRELVDVFSRRRRLLSGKPTMDVDTRAGRFFTCMSGSYL